MCLDIGVHALAGELRWEVEGASCFERAAEQIMQAFSDRQKAKCNTAKLDRTITGELHVVVTGASLCLCCGPTPRDISPLLKHICFGTCNT